MKIQKSASSGEKEINNLSIPSYKFPVKWLWLLIIFCSAGMNAQVEDTLTAAKLKDLSLEELLNLEVTSVSKHTEKLVNAASAIQVITNVDIRNSGAVTLADALKLASNIQSAQVNSSQWAISSRGFNNVLANKLLVLIDGRVVYTPMYGGVFWDVQNVHLSDVDRIEVISGPGGTLWGANAVNGIINVVTKKASETLGTLVEVASGTTIPVSASIRYGGKIKEDFSYRIYGLGYKMASTLDTVGKSANDEWSVGQGGFRADWKVSKKDYVTFQGNVYYGRPNPDGIDSMAIIARGDNFLARWERSQSENMKLSVQAYYDHTWRDFRNGFAEDQKTFDIEGQSTQKLGERQVLTYGLGLRMLNHNVENLEFFGFFPGSKKLYLYNVFLQYELMLIKDRLRLTVGSKLEYNSYTKIQNQPNGRLTWFAGPNQTLWAAISRAVRNPSRIDRDFAVMLAPNVPLIGGSDDFRSETLTAHEIGWRFQPWNKLSASVATFYNQYDYLRSAEPGSDTSEIPITFANGVAGETYGVEFAANSQINSWLNLRGGYTFMKKELKTKPGSNDLNEATAESNDPEHQFVLQSNVVFPRGVEFGTVLRYVDALPNPRVSGYTALDIRLGWHLSKVVEVAIVGQNLLDNENIQFRASTPPRQIERNIYGKLLFRF